MSTATVNCPSDKIKTIAYTPGSAIVVDTIQLVNGLVTIAYADIAAGVEGTFIYKADYVTAPKAAVAITQGEKAYWDDTAKVFTNVATANTLCGRFLADQVGGDANATLELTPDVV